MAEEHPDDKRLMELLRLHSEEVRFQVTLTWDRAKSSLAFHAAWIAIVANTAGRGEPYRHFAAHMFTFAFVSVMLGGFMVNMGHENYVAARERRREIERRMETQFAFVSTPGVREKSGPKWVRIYIILVMLHFFMGMLALSGAIAYWR